MTNSRIDILFKTLTLLYRESELGVTQEDSSKDLAKTVLSTFATQAKNNQLIGGDSSIIDDLKYLIQDLANNPDGYDSESLLQSLSVILKDKKELFESVKKSIVTDMGIPALKRSILTLRNRLNNYYKEHELKSLISKASYAINTGSLGSVTLLEYAKSLATNIEALTYTTNKTKDPAIVDEFDINSEDVSKLFDKVVGEESKGQLLTFAWKELVDMYQGGWKRGYMVDIYALQHSYKSSLLRTLFAQLLMCNDPVMLDSSKKPLMVLLSLEDDTDVMLGFFYRYLWYSEFGEVPDIDTVMPVDAAKYVRDKLSSRGYSVKMLRVNPSEFSYKQMFNLTMRYEADGYETHAVVCDYLDKIPTVGCIQGPVGTDKRDLFNRVRNYYSSRSTLFVTAHQLSSEAKQLARSGLKGDEFLSEIEGKGYTDGCRNLDQIVDAELYIARATINRKWHLFFRRGKDRRPGIIPDEKKAFNIPFPKDAPIPSDLSLVRSDSNIDSSLEDEALSIDI